MSLCYYLTPAEFTLPERQLELLSVAKFENPFLTSYSELILRSLGSIYGIGDEQIMEYLGGMKDGYWKYWPQGNWAIPAYHCHPMLMSGALFTSVVNLHYSAKQPPWGIEATLPSLLRRHETEYSWYDAAYIWAKSQMYSVFVAKEILAALCATNLTLTTLGDIRWPRAGVLLSFPVGLLQVEHPLGISITQILAVRTRKQDRPQFSLPGMVSNIQTNDGLVTLSLGVTARGLPVLLTTDIVGITADIPEIKYDFQSVQSLLFPKIPTTNLSQFVLNLTLRVLTCMSVNPEHLDPFTIGSTLIEPTTTFGARYKIRGLTKEQTWNWGSLSLTEWQEPYLFEH